MKTRKPPTTDEAVILGRVRHLLDNGRAEEAVQVLAGCGCASKAVENAKGVCLMRMGKPEAAAKIFCKLVFPDKGFTIPDDVPTTFRANYATAWFLTGDFVAGSDLLRQIRDHDHPAVRRLRAAVRQWKRSLPWWRRLLLPLLGIGRARPMHVGLAPGDLWTPGGPTPMDHKERVA